jgi:acyl-CoA thioester hydrolase|tara:strand:- start:1556 stop:1966 length:411 start_codon:yes stop_codon:yes gene_type:complete
LICEGDLFEWPVRVYYEDTDAGGVVYYANYLKFMERARTEWLRSHGLDLAQLVRDENAMFVVRQVQLDFHRPAYLSDNLAVSVQVQRRRRVSVDLAQAVSRKGTELCAAQVRLACVDSRTLRPRLLPASLIEENNN